uniref:Uncharacterized protein n=1 Tax=Aplanochytrium stocchinoi TaxID=215587 RepID=A0A7S3LMG5_9STRA|mmetsp:Transcript_2931/g.3704  ORF Transcript_2931/g.3704 Transcript_2931/m.3704 type:complete len:170 (-) Transcript_2931:629-1138(-)
MGFNFGGFVCYESPIPKLCSCFYPVIGITLFPFICFSFSEKEDESTNQDVEILPLSREVIVNHERIHIAQAAETCCAGMYIIWLYDFFKGLCCLKNREPKFCGCQCNAEESYFWNRIEQEAFDNQYDKNYLRKRKQFAWINYPSKSVRDNILGEFGPVQPHLNKIDSEI